jgi:hypothetical protein
VCKSIEERLAFLKEKHGGGREPHVIRQFIKDLLLYYRLSGGNPIAYWSEIDGGVVGKFAEFCEAICKRLPANIIQDVDVRDMARSVLFEERKLRSHKDKIT